MHSLRGMATNSAYCKAYYVSKLRSFSGWVEDTASLRKERVEDGEVERVRTSLLDTDILYLHASYVVTDGVFEDEHVVFNNVTQAWKAFCADTLGFSIPDYVLAATQPR